MMLFTKLQPDPITSATAQTSRLITRCPLLQISAGRPAQAKPTAAACLVAGKSLYAGHDRITPMAVPAPRHKLFASGEKLEIHSLNN
jgi:hypothetical protein